MKVEAAARQFAQTDAEYAGWIRHLKDLDNAYDIFLLHKPIIPQPHATQSSRFRL
jgi:hypothetical protein